LHDPWAVERTGFEGAGDDRVDASQRLLVVEQDPDQLRTEALEELDVGLSLRRAAAYMLADGAQMGELLGGPEVRRPPEGVSPHARRPQQGARRTPAW
jgi:hypothetical protein